MNSDTPLGDIVAGVTVLTPDGRSGVVRFVYETAEGQVAVIKFGDADLLTVIPLTALSLLPPDLLDGRSALGLSE
jgi:hypothetical protein